MDANLECKLAEKMELIEMDRIHNENVKFYKNMAEKMAKYSEELKLMYNSLVMYRLETADVRLQYQTVFDRLESIKNSLEN